MKKINLRRKSLIIAALLAAVSVGAGTAGTVAFFQSNHSFDITVQAAKVDVEQGKPKLVDTASKLSYGTVKVNPDDSVSASDLVPGDTFLLKVSYTNHSTIGIKYSIHANATTGLKAEFFTDEACTKSAEDTSAFVKLAKGGTIPVHFVKVTATDELINGSKGGKVTIGVDAVQDNADLVTDDTTFGTKLTEGGEIDLGDDVSLTLDSPSLIEKDTVIDLKGKTLSLDAKSKNTALSVENGSTLTLKNGSVKGTGKGANSPLIQTKTGNIVLDNVNYTAKDGNALQYEGSGSNVTIKDSTITVDGGYYGIATNANGALGDQSNSSVNITGSTISVTNKEHDNAAIFFNVGGKYSISDSIISGQRQGIMVRSGYLTLNNVTIDKTEEFPKETVDAGKFGSGNEVPQAALFLGNNVNAGYEKASIVTFDGPVNFTGVGPKIVASGSTTQDVDLETGTYYTGDVKVYDFRKDGDTHKFTINGTDIKIGDYKSDGTSVYKIA